MPHWDRFANRNTLWASLFMDELARGGVDCVTISPGSRSTPLTLAAAHTQGLRCTLALDERSASFFALGHAKATGRPSVLICTSGSAAANYHPAVLEADLSATPLLILTADRPPLLRGVGEGQTIDQLKLFGNAVRWFHEVGEPVMGDKDLRSLKSLAARAVSTALGITAGPAGPVHLNFAFRKPLEAQIVAGDIPPNLRASLEGDTAEMDTAKDDARTARPFGAGYRGQKAPSRDLIEQLADQIRATPRGLFLCGPMNREMGDHEWPEAMARLAARCGYPILAEPPSGLLGGAHDTSHMIAHSEAILRHEGFRKGSAPDLVFRFGAMPTPKTIEVLLDDNPACPVVLVDEWGRWREPTHHPTRLAAADPTRFCADLADALEGHTPEAGWLERFRHADGIAARAITQTFTAPEPDGLGDDWFEGRVFSELADLLPEDAVLYTASSMPVRDLAYFHPITETRIHHQVNRGANGIDGTVSSALGAAAAAAGEGRPTVLVTGDLAFLHDANGIHIARQYEIPLTIVLINNDGGGIFEMLPVSEYGEAFERYFGTPHGLDLASFCAGHGIPHQRPNDWPAFRAMVTKSIGANSIAANSNTKGSSAGPSVIEIQTQRTKNKIQHRTVWAAVSHALDASSEI